MIKEEVIRQRESLIGERHETYKFDPQEVQSIFQADEINLTNISIQDDIISGNKFMTKAKRNKRRLSFSESYEEVSNVNNNSLFEATESIISSDVFKPQTNKYCAAGEIGNGSNKYSIETTAHYDSMSK